MIAVASGNSKVVARGDSLFIKNTEDKPQQKSYTYPQTLIQKQRPVPVQNSVGTVVQISIGANNVLIVESFVVGE